MGCLDRISGIGSGACVVAGFRRFNNYRGCLDRISSIGSGVCVFAGFNCGLICRLGCWFWFWLAS